MGDFSVFSVASNVEPAFRSSALEALIAGAADLKGFAPVVIALDPDVRLRSGAGKVSKDDPLHRYGRALAASPCPLLFRSEARELFEDAAKPRNADLLADRSLAMLLESTEIPRAARSFDAYCFILAADRTSIAFLFDISRAIRSVGGTAPFRILIAGEPHLERAADYFVELRNELRTADDDPAEYVFCGSISFDQQELELAGTYGLSATEAFARSTTAGQARYAARRLFSRLSIETKEERVERLRSLGALLA